MKGIVVHQGTADAGHYYCYIQNREHTADDNADDSWFCFNDKEVEKFDPTHIPDQAFGGENEHYEQQIKQHANDPAMVAALQTQGRMKTNNAYILIYERENFIDQERFSEFTDDLKVAMANKSPSSYQLASKKAFGDCRLAETVSTQIQISPMIQD